MNILTFDIEEWFHILDNPSTKSESQWNNYEVRIHKNMDKIFSLLEDHNLKATFFVVGWIASKYPDIVKKIDSYGFEIGSHTHMHQLMYEQTKSQVQEDLKKSISTIENIISKKIKYFRAPGFSITENNKWIFEILVNNGITHDCSIFPSGRSHGGFPSFKIATPSIIEFNGKKIKEFPINTHNFCGNRFVFSGGGYFRLIPYSVIKNWSKRTNYIMTYFHPRDFDPDQPIIQDLSFFRKFKSYVGLGSCLSKLEKWVIDFNFTDLKNADNQIDWNKVPIIKF